MENKGSMTLYENGKFAYQKAQQTGRLFWAQGQERSSMNTGKQGMEKARSPTTYWPRSKC